jgi:hypothetical protein
MMFGNPISRETQAFCMARQIGGVGQRLRYAAAFDNGDEIK